MSTIREQCTAYLSYVELERGLSPTTRSSYGQDLAQLEAFLKGRHLTSLAAVRPVHVREFLHVLRSTVSPSTVARKLSAVRGLFKFLEGQRELHRNPTVVAPLAADVDPT